MTKKTTETLSRREVAGLAAAVAALAATPAMANQPHMEAALETCHSAHQQLKLANDNKGGHRNRAIEYLEAAIAEIKAGIAYAG